MFKEKERTRKQSVLYLVLWLVFIFIFLIAIKINSSKRTVVEEIKPQYITVDKGFERLNANNYEYNYVITNGEDKTYYTGVIEGNVNTGTKIYKDEVINYVNNGINTIDINTNETVDIYGDILYEFLNPNNLYNYLKNIKYIIKEEDNLKKYIYDSTYNLEDIHIEVSVDTKDITSINYNYLNLTYSLLYSNIRD
ncbi:MAG: hypothetical protein SOZ04_04040 [Bacilli bacterium]|nr:hypothetical protein [Bacilli bacterium]